MILRNLMIAAAVSLTVVASASAQTKGPNGGPVVTAEGHPIEFVHNGLDISFFIVDDDRKTAVPTKGMRGRAVIQSGGKTATVNLVAAPPNKLVGKLQAPLAPKARVVMSTSMSIGGHRHTLQARFTVN